MMDIEEALNHKKSLEKDLFIYVYEKIKAFNKTTGLYVKCVEIEMMETTQIQDLRKTYQLVSTKAHVEL